MPFDGSLSPAVPRIETSSRPSSQEFYIPSLDGIRACAVMLVFLAHAGLAKYWSTSGGFGVTVFFFLSGYLITTLLRQEMQRTGTVSLRKFYLRRSFRILPPMYLTLAVAYMISATGILAVRGSLFGLISAVGYFFNYADLLSHRATLPTGLSVLWSLMIEEHFYLVFPLLYLTLFRRRFDRRKQTTILIGLCVLALAWRCCVVFAIGESFTETRWTYTSTDCRFDSILFGCVLAIRNNPCFKDSSRFLHRYRGLFAVAGFVLIAGSLAWSEPHFRETLRYTLQSVGLYPIFYYCISSHHEWPVRWLEWKPVRWVGWISYSMYLIHVLFLRTGLNRFPSHPVLVGLAGLALSLLYGWLMRIGVEMPLRGYRVRLEAALKERRRRRELSPATPFRELGTL